MKPRKAPRHAWLYLWLLAAPLAPACADIVPLGSAYHSGVLVNGSSLVATTFSSALAGTVSLSLMDNNFMALLQSLTTYVSSNNVTLYTLSSAHSLDFHVDAGQVFATTVVAMASQVAGGIGSYSMDLHFVPTATAVPLFSSGWLLMSGLLVLGAFRRRVEAVTVIESK